MSLPEMTQSNIVTSTVVAAVFVGVAGLGYVVKQNADNHEDTKACLRDALLHETATHAALSSDGLACHDENGERLGDLFIRSATLNFGDDPSMDLNVHIEYAPGVSTKGAAAKIHKINKGTGLYEKVSENILSYTAE